jgi:NTP pyrophosphatase (non-canonical NTP hydrolase)
MELNTIAWAANQNSEAHGFWDDEPVDSDFPNREEYEQALGHYLGNKLMLIVGEVSEAHEDLRAGRMEMTITPVEVPGTVVVNGAAAIEEWRKAHPGKPEGLPSELADIIIRVGDLAHRLGIDLDSVVELKHAYNVTRPFKHGKAF